MSLHLRAKLEALVKPIVTAMGYELWDLEVMAQNGHKVMRVFIDREQGISINDLTNISHQLQGVLSVEGYSDFNLEVSSPGLDRKLLTLDHYRRFIGQMVKIKLWHLKPMAQYNYAGKIAAVNENGVIIETEGKELIFTLAEIEKANLIAQNIFGNKSNKQK